MRLQLWTPAVVGVIAFAGTYLVLGQPPAEPSVDQAVAQVSHFVESQRGLTFTSPPKVTFLSDAQFSRRLTAIQLAANSPDQVAAQGDVMESVGLIPAGTNLATLVTTLGSGEGVGSYDLRTGDVLIRGETVTPYRRQVLAHELTHALDDQQFHLGRHPTASADGSGWAFTNLVEGDARTVENDYYDSMSAAEQRSADAERAAVARATNYRAIPESVLTMTGAPYLSGPVLIKAILDHGGNAALNRAFASPPTTAQQAMYPDLYLNGSDPVAVAAPPSPRPPLSTGVFGAFFLHQILSADADAAYWAARNWAGDRFATWRATDGYCTSIALITRNPTDIGRLAVILGEWAAHRPHGTVGHGLDSVTVTSCSEGSH